jgi:hypothetical protein
VKWLIPPLMLFQATVLVVENRPEIDCKRSISEVKERDLRSPRLFSNSPSSSNFWNRSFVSLFWKNDTYTDFQFLVYSTQNNKKIIFFRVFYSTSDSGNKTEKKFDRKKIFSIFFFTICDHDDLPSCGSSRRGWGSRPQFGQSSFRIWKIIISST